MMRGLVIVSVTTHPIYEDDLLALGVHALHIANGFGRLVQGIAPVNRGYHLPSLVTKPFSFSVIIMFTSVQLAELSQEGTGQNFGELKADGGFRRLVLK
jgi:hypothetical protein